MSLDNLISETRNPSTWDLDQLSTLDIITRFNQEDHKVPQAIAKILPQIAQVVDLAAEALAQGGRLIYLGAGSSGRLGVLDAVECSPTFGVAQGVVVGLMAGGVEALLNAVEGAEDNTTLGEEDLQSLNITSYDIVIGLTASGRTPYVIGGLKYAKQQGCTTVAIACNPDALVAQYVQVAILPLVGPEVLTGSTRMKSGTAQKLVLNMISTGVMVKLGKVYQNLMVDVRATNVKLLDRAQRIIMEVTGCSRQEAGSALLQTQGEVKPAILLVLAECSAKEAKALLAAHRGYLRAALAARG